MNTAHPQIIVVGSSNTDLTVRVAEPPLPGQTVLGSDLARTQGGKGANQAVAARRMGARVAFVGCLGDDVLGDDAAAALAAEGIDLTHLRRATGIPSGVALITVSAAGENSIVVAPGANGRLTPDDLATIPFDGAALVIAQLEIPLATVIAAFGAARAAGVRTLLNPAPAQSLAHDLLFNTDILVLNATEAAALTQVPITDHTAAVVAIRQIFLLGPRLVVLTLGGAGCLIAERDSPVQGERLHAIPAFIVPVIDTTAAGDAFIGAFATGLVHGLTSLDAARLGSAAGALAVGKAGAQPSLPTAAAVQALLDRA